MRSLRVVFCLFLVSIAAFAQSDRGTMTGAVLDTSGAVIPGVSIAATNVETGARYETVSTETGNCSARAAFSTMLQLASAADARSLWSAVPA